tara:strand:+ start:234 stop:1205 length:972 start_codon:yes stop_codon:yes gene_type:complete
MIILVPVALAVIAFELLAPFNIASQSDLALAGGAIPSNPFPKNMLLFMGLQIVHVFVCTASVTLSVRAVYEQNRVGFVPFLAFSVIMAFGILSLFILLRPYDLVAYFFTHDFFVCFYSQTPIGEYWVHTKLFGLTILDLLVLTPTWLGVVAVIFAATASRTMLAYEPIYEPDEFEDADDAARLALLKLITYGLAAVLCSSALTATMYFHLPSIFLNQGIDSQMVQGAETTSAILTDLLERIRQFGADLSFYWSLIFSLTLITAVGLPMLSVYVRQGSATLREDNDFGSLMQIGGSALGKATMYLSPVIAGVLTRSLSIPGLSS